MKTGIKSKLPFRGGRSPDMSTGISRARESRSILYIAPIERSAKLRESSERRDYGHEKTMDRQGKARDSA